MYAYCGNNPIILVDPLGLSGDSSWASRAWGLGQQVYSGVASAVGQASDYVKSEVTYKYAPLVGLGPEGYSTGQAWDAFAIGYSKAGQGVVNVFTGGLFDRESGVFYKTFNRQWESQGIENNQYSPEFRSGEIGGRIGEGLLLTTAGVMGAEKLGLIDTTVQGNNVFRVMSKQLKRGFRIDKPHHGKWHHPHFWKW